MTTKQKPNSGPGHIRLPSGELAVEQGTMHGFTISYNPDDARLYVHGEAPNEVKATFAEVRNMRQYCKTHKATVPAKRMAL